MKTPNQNIRPVTLKRNEAQNLEIGGCDLVELAQKYATPLYVYDETTIRKICTRYKDAFKRYENTQMLYAAKAFMTKAICKIVDAEGFGFDCVSGGELATAKAASCDMEKIVFNGSNKSIDELEMALELGVGRISVDNFLELALLDNLVYSKYKENKKVKILLRIAPGIECHTHEYIQTGHLDSKFGFDLTQIDSAIELIKDEYTNLEIVGLHAHIGSQIFETQVYHDEVEILVKETARIKEKFGIELTEINFGGGLGISYTQNDAPPSIYEIANVIINSLEESIKKYGIKPPKIYLEPGRSVVATAGVTLYSIGSQKQVPQGKKYVSVDGGMADNPRPSMYQAIYTAEIANHKKTEETQTVTIAGRYCESGDILIHNIELPILEEGDILCVYDTGAYGYSMSSNYNRVCKSAVVLVNNSQSDIIVERQTYEDILAQDVIPERLK